MTFPAGGGNAGAPGGGSSSPAAPSTPDSDATATTSTAASDSEEAARAAAATDAPDDGVASTSAALPAPKIERPASFRETLERQRASASEGDDTATEKTVEKKPAATAEGAATATPKPDATKPAPAKTDAAKPATTPAPKTDAGTTAADAATTTAKQAKPEAPEESEDDAPSDEEILASENLDEELDKRFPEADKGKRGALDFAKRTARKNRELAPIAELVESVGGMDGAKLAFDYTKELTALSRAVASPEEAFEQAEGFRSFLHKNAPGALGKLESAIFWKAVEDTPEGLANVQALTDEIFGDGVLTVEQLKILGNAFAAGQIDLDELAGRGDYTMSKAERERKARENVKQTAREKELEARLAELEGTKKTADEAKAETHNVKVKEAMTSFVQGNQQLCMPILREYGFAYPDDPKSPQYAQMAWYIKNIQRDLEEELSKDEDFKTVIGNINNLRTDGVHAISVGATRNKMRVALRGILDQIAPDAAAKVKERNQLTAARVQKNGKATTTTTAPAKPRNVSTAAPSNSESAMQSVEERRERRHAAFVQSLEEGRRAEQ